MSKSLVDSLIDSVFDAKWTGRRGEKLTERELKLVNLLGRHGKTLRNIYVPKRDGETSEIDLVYITQKGIFVFESKNYSGWIFGDEKSQYWTAMLPGKQKNRFYNPVMQNHTHMKWLGEHIGNSIPLFSIIVFSERCELKKITVESPDVKVIKRDRIYATVRNIWKTAADKLSENEVYDLYERLRPLTEVDHIIKNAHIQNIQKRQCIADNNRSCTGSTPDADIVQSAENVKYCPLCGKKLILRTAKKGSNTGKQFYGCTGFPGCRYTASQ